jgi:hypothetical protein
MGKGGGVPTSVCTGCPMGKDRPCCHVCITLGKTFKACTVLDVNNIVVRHIVINPLPLLFNART